MSTQDNPSLAYSLRYSYICNRSRKTSLIVAPIMIFSAAEIFPLNFDIRDSHEEERKVREKNDDSILETRKRPIIRGGIGSSHGHVPRAR